MSFHIYDHLSRPDCYFEVEYEYSFFSGVGRGKLFQPFDIEAFFAFHHNVDHLACSPGLEVFLGHNYLKNSS